MSTTRPSSATLTRVPDSGLRRSSAPSLGARDALLIAVVCLAWAGNFLVSKLALRRVSAAVVHSPAFDPALCPVGALRETACAGAGATADRSGAVQWRGSFRALVLVDAAVHHAGRAVDCDAELRTHGGTAGVAVARRALRRRTALAIALSFGGVLVLGFDPVVLQAPAALGLMLVSAFFLALGTVLMRGLQGVDLASQQGWTAMIGIGPLLVWSLVMESNQLEAIRGASWVAWVGVGYTAVIA